MNASKPSLVQHVVTNSMSKRLVGNIPVGKVAAAECHKMGFCLTGEAFAEVTKGFKVPSDQG